MNIWKSLPGYPTSEDMVYEITSYLFKDGRKELEFSFQTLNSIFGKDWEQREHSKIINSMIEEGKIYLLDKKTNDKNWYKIKDNIYS